MGSGLINGENVCESFFTAEVEWQGWGELDTPRSRALAPPQALWSDTTPASGPQWVGVRVTPGLGGGLSTR